jgi:hypothetical protein
MFAERPGQSARANIHSVKPLSSSTLSEQHLAITCLQSVISCTLCVHPDTRQDIIDQQIFRNKHHDYGTPTLPIVF